MIEEDEKWIADLESGDVTDAFEAAKKIAHKKASQEEIDRLAYIAANGKGLHNRAAATGVLGNVDNRDAALAVLIGLLASADHHESVRGFAAEGIGAQCPPLGSRFRKKAVDVLVKALKDPSPTVRFWSCYAAGKLGSRKALPLLKELKTNDRELCPGWWYVSEEAEDAIEWIYGRESKERIPVSDRKSEESVKPR